MAHRTLLRFWKRMNHTESGCWEWQGARNPAGYGVVRVHYKMCRAHRVAYELTHGPIPDGLLACHRCDNPPCCNPDHLFLGTRKDNNDDRHAKGRTRSGAGSRYGEAINTAKLTADDVRAIRAQSVAGTSQMDLARQYPVTQSAIWAIVHYKSWKHI